MSIKAVLFDLDGTLLPMDQDEFAKAYLGLLGKRLASKGYEFEKFVKVMWAGVGAMVKNDGSCTNEEAFWRVFAEAFGEASLKDKPFIDEFYHGEFNKVQAVCGFHKMARKIVITSGKGGVGKTEIAGACHQSVISTYSHGKSYALGGIRAGNV